jgi:uncharacterized phiE125 gp8 family phage protein
MRYERTPNTGDPVSINELQEHMRLDGDLVSGAYAYSHAAAAEIEAYCGIALLTQTITAITDKWTGQSIMLPVGPVAADATITIHMIEQDGTATLIPDGYWLEGGRYPRIYFTGTPSAPLRITYTAGYGGTSTTIPADLRMAICDLSARLYDHRASEKAATFPAATARICARHRLVRINA